MDGWMDGWEAEEEEMNVEHKQKVLSEGCMNAI